MPQAIQNGSYLLNPHNLGRLDKNASLLVSKDGDLVQRITKKPNIIARFLFGRKVRFIYKTISSANHPSLKLKPTQVQTPQASRNALANSLIQHLNTTFPDQTVRSTIRKFVDNMSRHINQSIRGDKQHAPESSVALDAKTAKNTLQEIGSQMQRLKLEWNNKENQRENQFDKFAFVYNKSIEVKDHSLAESHRKTEMHHNAARTAVFSAKNTRRASSLSHVAQSFKSMARSYAESFLKEEQISDRHQALDRLEEVVSTVIDNAKSKKAQTTIDAIERVFDEMPRFVADIAYDLKNNPSKLEDPSALVVTVSKYLPEAITITPRATSPSQETIDDQLRTLSNNPDQPPPKPPRSRKTPSPST